MSLLELVVMQTIIIGLLSMLLNWQIALAVGVWTLVITIIVDLWWGDHGNPKV